MEDRLGLHFSLVVRSNIITASSPGREPCAGVAGGWGLREGHRRRSADIRARSLLPERLLTVKLVDLPADSPRNMSCFIFWCLRRAAYEAHRTLIKYPQKEAFLHPLFS